MKITINSISSRTPNDEIALLIAKSRKSDSIYALARKIGIARRHLHLYITLTRAERKKLLSALRRARYGKILPLAPWLPRGYQILRLMWTIKDVMPEKNIKITHRDIRLITRALREFRDSREKWLSNQIASLKHSAKSIDLSLPSARH